MLREPTRTEELRNDVRFALRFEVGRKQQPPTDTERDMVAAAIVEHIRLCNWKVERAAPWGGFAELGQGPARQLRKPRRDGAKVDSRRNAPHKGAEGISESWALGQADHALTLLFPPFAGVALSA
jgi:hypothetical protein